MARSKPKKRAKKPTLPKLKEIAWKLTSQAVRRGAADFAGNVECYTCGKVLHWKEAQAGHAIGGRTGSVLLDRSLLRCQCAGCNIFNSGEYGIFAAKLIAENGLDWYNAKQAGAKQIKKWSRVELEETCQQLYAELAEMETV